jgi:DNA-binding CsgD family transcriptional regulator
MGSPALGTKREKPVPERVGGRGVEALVRQLLEQLARDPPRGNLCTDDGSGRAVMLDVEVDGVRCVLYRAASSSGHDHIVLSPREREIARMVAKGYPNKTIAGVLDLSIFTVSTYLRRIFAKLGVGSRAAMVAHLLADGSLGNPLEAGFQRKP